MSLPHECKWCACVLPAAALSGPFPDAVSDQLVAADVLGMCRSYALTPWSPWAQTMLLKNKNIQARADAWTCQAFYISSDMSTQLTSFRATAFTGPGRISQERYHEQRVSSRPNKTRGLDHQPRGGRWTQGWTLSCDQLAVAVKPPSLHGPRHGHLPVSRPAGLRRLPIDKLTYLCLPCRTRIAQERLSTSAQPKQNSSYFCMIATEHPGSHTRPVTPSSRRAGRRIQAKGTSSKTACC